ncbi:MAG: hypothetical protein J6V20_00585 [Bacteroidaceae bacterium]|nr:hypothetical protein [Bacteroidaceae bacterium]
MKKFYVSPIATEVNFEVADNILLALSVEIKDGNTFVDTEEEGGQLTSGNRREWGNLWK